jgi:hypothetical protein
VDRQEIAAAIRTTHVIIDSSLPIKMDMSMQDSTALRVAAFSIVLQKLIDDSAEQELAERYRQREDS